MPYELHRMGGGLSLKAPATAIKDDQLQRARGCRFDTLGAVSSARGRSYIAEVAGALAGEVRGTGEFITSAGVKKRITKAGTTLYEDASPIGTFTGTDHISVVSYNGYAYISDGTTSKRWDGTSLIDIGLAAPSAALSTAVSGSGNTIATGTYKYVFTYFNGVAESNFPTDSDGNHLLASQAVTLGEQVDLSGITVGPTGTTARRIYRTTTNGTAYFYLGEITDNTTTTYTDTAKYAPGADTDESTTADITDTLRGESGVYSARNQAQYPMTASLRAKFHNRINEARTNTMVGEPREITPSNLGLLADWTDHDQPPSDIRNLRLMNGQVFGITGNSVQFTRTIQPEHWPALYEFKVGRQSGETLQAIEVYRENNLVCYTDSSVWRFQLIGVSAIDSRLVQIQSPVGCVGKRAVAVLDQGPHVFMAKSGLYIFDGDRVQEASFAIEELFEDSDHEDYINPTYMSTVQMAAHRDRIWISYGRDAANDRLLVVDFQDIQNPKFSTKVDSITTLWREEGGNVLVGGTADGRMFTMDSGNADGHTAIQWDVKTKDFVHNDETVVSRYQKVVLDADTGGADTTVTVNANLDDKIQTATLTFTGTQAGRRTYQKRLPSFIQGRSVNVTVSSSAKAARHLYGVGFEYEGAEGV